MKKIFIISIILTLFFINFAFAQEISQVPTVNQEEVQQAEFNAENNLFNIYQITNDSINRLISIFTVIASIFAIFITGLVLFFAVKQISADREIRSYKEAVKQSKIAIEEETQKRLTEIKTSMEEITEEKNKIKEDVQKIAKMKRELKPASLKKIKTSKDLKEAQSAITNLNKKIEELEDKLNIQKGKISTVSGWTSSINISDTPSSISSSIDHSDGLMRVYSGNISTSGYCRNCHHFNELGANFCAKCGSGL